MNTVVISNESLRPIHAFLPYDHFIEISTPNFHRQPGGIENAAHQAIAYGKPAVYLVSAGMSAALIIDKIYDYIPDSFFIDCGSIWDGFVRVGGQRAWREMLYMDERRWTRWYRRNVYGC